jgi:hypothetical protein
MRYSKRSGSVAAKVFVSVVSMRRFVVQPATSSIGLVLNIPLPAAPLCGPPTFR